MSTLSTIADVLARVGDVPPARLPLSPPPGTATEADLLREWEGPNRRLFELIDGILVEKAMGAPESLLAIEVAGLLREYVRPRRLGKIYGADGLLRLAPGLVRVPDVSFVPKANIPDKKLLRLPVAPFIPSFAVEVLSPGNTVAEIDLKIRDLFFAGTKLMWVIRPKTESAQVYTSPIEVLEVPRGGQLDASPILPGFVVSLAELFTVLDDDDDPAAGA